MRISPTMGKGMAKVNCGVTGESNRSKSPVLIFKKGKAASAKSLAGAWRRAASRERFSGGSGLGNGGQHCCGYFSRPRMEQGPSRQTVRASPIGRLDGRAVSCHCCVSLSRGEP